MILSTLLSALISISAEGSPFSLDHGLTQPWPHVEYTAPASVAIKAHYECRGGKVSLSLNSTEGSAELASLDRDGVQLPEETLRQVNTQMSDLGSLGHYTLTCESARRVKVAFYGPDAAGLGWRMVEAYFGESDTYGVRSQIVPPR